MSAPTLPSIVPAPVKALIEVFDEHLSELSFPDLDRDSLHDHARQVAQSLAELEAARARVEAARAELDAAQAALVKHARKGLAYARIYAQDEDALSDSLAEIEFEPKSKPRRKRVRKKKESVAPLPLEQEALRVAS